MAMPVRIDSRASGHAANPVAQARELVEMLEGTLLAARSLLTAAEVAGGRDPGVASRRRWVSRGQCVTQGPSCRARKAAYEPGVARAATGCRGNDALTRLTAREVEVLALLAAGRSNRDIARVLFLSPRTVQRHVANAYLKIDAHCRAEATAFAIDHGLR